MKSLKGYYLLAVPELRDPSFRQSVVLLVQHDDNGALGLIMNRPLQTTVAEAWKQVQSEPCRVDGPLHMGGPCEGPMIVLHDVPDLGQIEVIPGVYFTTEADQITRLITGGPEGEGARRLKCFVGYAGWTGGQLEAELGQEGWIIGPAATEGIFDTHPQAWIRLLHQFSSALRFPDVSPDTMPPDPSVN